MQDEIPDGALAAELTDQAIESIRKQATLRSVETQTSVFTEAGQTLRLLADHVLLKSDVQFQSMVQNLAGAEDMDVFHDRVIALESYVLEVAQANGAEISGKMSGGANRMTLTQVPYHLSDLDDDINARTRLQMR